MSVSGVQSFVLVPPPQLPVGFDDDDVDLCLLKRRKRPLVSELSDGRRKRKRQKTCLRKHITSTYQCSICQEMSKLFVSTCRNHFTCLPCMSLLTSSGAPSNCPLCPTTNFMAECNISEDNNTPVWTGIQNILPPPRDLDLVHGSKKVTCGSDGCSYKNSPINVIRHYFNECKGTQLICPQCTKPFTRESFQKHLRENECLSITCEHEGCKFKLFKQVNTSEEAQERNEAHTKYHSTHTDFLTTLRKYERYYDMLNDFPDNKYMTNFATWFNQQHASCQTLLFYWREEARQATHINQVMNENTTSIEKIFQTFKIQFNAASIIFGQQF